MALPAATAGLNFDGEVRRCERQLFRIAVGLMGSEADAWDALQEALIRAYTRLPQFRGDARFSTWLCRILYHTCYDELRRRRRRPLPWGRGSTADPDHPVAAEPGVRVPDDEGAPDPADLAEQHEVQQLVRREVNRLEPPFRQVVVLRDLQGHSYEEIAGALGLPTGTVKSRLNRARARLKRQLEPTPA